MPKKHHNHLISKPKSTPPQSLESSKLAQHGGRPSTPAATTVNDLIGRLRIAQSPPIRPDVVTPSSSKSLPPHLRTILNVPSPLPPKPRAGFSANGRIRRTAGPPAPQSWLESSRHAPDEHGGLKDLGFLVERRLDTLPGADFPRRSSLEDVVLKQMARVWTWHLENDGIYMSDLPTPLKERLLSYIATYAPTESSVAGFRALFPRAEDVEGFYEGTQDEYNDVTRLDLSGFTGCWQSKTSLRKALLYDRKITSQAKSSKATIAADSWEEMASEGEEGTLGSATLRSDIEISPTLRFPNLAHLSLASMTFGSGSVSWSALLSVAPYLSTLTSLSLANWPVPSASSSSVIPVVILGNPNEDLDQLSKARSVIKRLSKHLYCLKWLDLSGCASWVSALIPERPQQIDTETDGFPAYLDISRRATTSPWTGPWRNIEHVRFSTNWIPKAFTDVGLLDLDNDTIADIKHGNNSPSVSAAIAIRPSAQATEHPLTGLRYNAFDTTSLPGQRMASSRSLTRASTGMTPQHTTQDDGVTLSWDMDEEREIYHQKKEISAYMADIKHIKQVADQIQTIRREAKGKFIRFDFGY